ncbi:MAG TPA: NAD-dependent succinate-semialdehyde dehydrogenase, partial [Brachybacterium paraconglomeratum]|nr:NAD-dependent succinate-semialdehyde dehydrogenase [Brachybacterium paraconglomeratum]
MPEQPALTPTRIAQVLERTPTSSFVGGRFLGGTAALEVIDPATGTALTRVVDADAASVGAKA